MLVLFAATGIMVAAVLALTLRSWWVLLGVLFVHLLATVAVVGYTLQRATDTHEKPDPVTEARVEEERAEEEAQPRKGDRDREVFS
jgi:membrane protein implicated in regulation of membrane protease activity